MTEVYLPESGTADIVRMEGVPGDLATGVYRVEFCGMGDGAEYELEAIPVFRFLGAGDEGEADENPPWRREADENPPWRRPGVRYLTSTEQRQIRALYAQRDERGRRLHTQQELASRFGTTPITVSRLTRGKDHVPVPRRRRRPIIHDHEQETGT